MVDADTATLIPLQDELWENEAMAVEGALFKELKNTGFSRPFLFDANADLSLQELRPVLADLLNRSLTAGDVLGFKQLVDLSEKFARRMRRQLDVVLNEPWTKPRVVTTPVFTERERLLSKLNAKARLPIAAFPTSSGKKLETKEDRRKRYAYKIGLIVVECNFPGAALLQSSVAPERLMSKFAGGKRLSTLQNKISTYEAMKLYMEPHFGKCFPSREIELLDYILDRSDEPCGPSVPASILQTTQFFEQIGGRLPIERVSTSALVKGVVDDVRVSLTSLKPRLKKKAHQFPSVFVGAWELMVADEGLYDIHRLIVWEQLLAIWAALRTSDTSGIPQGSIRLVDGTLHGEIHCSKTTGVGKSIGIVPFLITGEAWLINPFWLSQGYDLFQKYQTGLPFLLPLPKQDYLEFSKDEPTYSQKTATMRKLISQTCKPVYKDSDSTGFYTWQLTITPIILLGMQAFWSGHSGRCTVPTWAAALGFGKEDRNNVGRWCPEESDEYVRNAARVIARIQEAVAVKMRSILKADTFHEKDLFKQFTTFCLERGLDHAEIEVMIADLTHSGFEGKLDDVESDLEGTVTEIPLLPENFDPMEQIDVTDTKADLEDGQLVVSLSKAGDAMTLHRLGGCWRIPGIHYRRFEAVAEGELDKSVYNTLCKDCWPKKSVVEEDKASSSEHSSSDEDNTN